MEQVPANSLVAANVMATCCQMFGTTTGPEPRVAEAAAGGAEPDAWEALAQVLLLSNEFAYVD